TPCATAPAACGSNRCSRWLASLARRCRGPTPPRGRLVVRRVLVGLVVPAAVRPDQEDQEDQAEARASPAAPVACRPDLAARHPAPAISARPGVVQADLARWAV